MAPHPNAVAKIASKRIRATLREVSGRSPRRFEHAHAQAEPIVAYGLPRPRWPELLRRWRRDFRDLELAERLALAAELLAAGVEEEGLAAVSILRGGAHELTPAHYPALGRLADDFTSWSITDDFATGKGSITAPLLERFPDDTLELLRGWRGSRQRLKRRAGIVTFTRATAASGLYTDEILELCGALQFDPEDLVQKAVGWALKDVMRAGPGPRRRALALLKRMRRAGVPSTITLYAARDLEGPERAALLQIRKSRTVEELSR